MSFAFIHTADWQIGKPFQNFPERVAGRLEGARLDAIDRLAEAARARGIAHVLVAGDVWDSERLPGKVERQPLARMAGYADIVWVLIPGNHDAARPGSVWTRLTAFGLPSNVRPLVETVPVEIAPGAVVLPAPLKARSSGRDPTEWMDGAATPAGALRIGLAHGSVKGFGLGEEGEANIPIDAARARRAGLAYLALGDWHGATRIGARTWYSGTPEPDRFKDNEPGEALAVRLSGDAEPEVERVPIGHFTWMERAAELRDIAGLASIEDEIRRRGVPLDRMLVRLVLTGRLVPADLYRVEAWRESLSGALQHFECDVRAIGVAQGALDAETFGVAGELRAAADSLVRLAAQPGDPRAADAVEALRRLAGILADLREGAR